eukprot:271715-Chlamydomonas_euryale.AAC.3
MCAASTLPSESASEVGLLVIRPLVARAGSLAAAGSLSQESLQGRRPVAARMCAGSVSRQLSNLSQESLQV